LTTVEYEEIQQRKEVDLLRLSFEDFEKGVKLFHEKLFFEIYQIIEKDKRIIKEFIKEYDYDIELMTNKYDEICLQTQLYVSRLKDTILQKIHPFFLLHNQVKGNLKTFLKQSKADRLNIQRQFKVFYDEESKKNRSVRFLLYQSQKNELFRKHQDNLKKKSEKMLSDISNLIQDFFLQEKNSWNEELKTIDTFISDERQSKWLYIEWRYMIISLLFFLL
jgi:hypothetical protein